MTESENNKNIDENKPAEDLATNAESKAENKEQEEQRNLENELLAIKDKYLRLAADFENYKKISQREQGVAIKFAGESLITSLLPIMDNLQSALLASNESSSNLLIGIQMVMKQFEETLGKFGVKFFSAQGQMFDPSCHEAINEKEDDSVPEGTVVQEYQKGCYLHDRLIRPARVLVAKKSNNGGN